MPVDLSVEDEPFFAEERRNDARGEECVWVAAGQLGAVGGDGGELDVGDGRDGDAEVRGDDPEAVRLEGGRVAEDGAAALVLGAEEAGGESCEEERRGVGQSFDGRDDGAVEGEVVRVAVGAIGAEGHEEVGRAGGDGVGDGGEEAGVPGETAVGEAGRGPGDGAEHRAGGPELAEAEVGEGGGGRGLTGMALAAFTGRDGDDGAVPAGAGREGEGAGGTVGFVVGVRDEDEEAGHGVMVAGGGVSFAAGERQRAGEVVDSRAAAARGPGRTDPYSRRLGQMPGRLEGKVAIVTGAGRGIGRAEALALAREGCRVIVNDVGGSAAGEGRDTTPAEEVVAEIKKMGGEAVPNFGDVTSMADGEAIVKQALDTWGRLDILVNNAGILRDRIIFNMTEAEWDAVIAVHLKGHFTITKHAAMVFRQQRGGRIINTSSESGLGNLGQANYAAAKEGIVGLTRTLALDLGKYGVTANAIRPRAATRLTLSPEMEAARARRAQLAAQGQEPATPSTSAEEAIARIASMAPELVAPLVVYLCLPEAANVNGRDFIVGGDEISLMSLPTREKTIYKKGGWDLESLIEVFPGTLGAGLVNPRPPEQA